MSMWNMVNTLSLIDDLRDNPFLWDQSLPLYRFRNKKFEIYDELAKKYTVNPSEIERKIQSLKSQFRREHKKIKEKESESENKGKPKCNWFGYTPLLFLLNQTDEGNEKSVYETTGAKIIPDVLENTVEPDESVENNEMNYSHNIDSQSQTITEKCVVKTEPNDLGNGTLQCMKTLIDVVTKRDEFSVYGDYIADKLRNSGRSKIEVHIAQHHIDNVAFNLIMGVYGRGGTDGADVLNINAASEIPNLALKEEKM